MKNNLIYKNTDLCLLCGKGTKIEYGAVLCLSCNFRASIVCEKNILYIRSFYYNFNNKYTVSSLFNFYNYNVNFSVFALRDDLDKININYNYKFKHLFSMDEKIPINFKISIYDINKLFDKLLKLRSIS